MLEMQNLLRRSLDKPEVKELETNVVLYENVMVAYLQTTGSIIDQEQQGQQVHPSRATRTIEINTEIVGIFLRFSRNSNR